MTTLDAMELGQFLQIDEKTLFENNHPYLVIWAMRKSINSEDPELVALLKKHLRELFPEWEKIFGEKNRIRLDSIELSEAGLQKLKSKGFIYLDEIIDWCSSPKKRIFTLPGNWRLPDVDYCRLNRLVEIVKKSWILPPPHACMSVGFFYCIFLLIFFILNSLILCIAICKVRFYYITWMQKILELFDLWNEQKKKIEFYSNDNLSVDVWEIRWYFEWVNIGHELSKDGLFKRPCLVLQKWIEDWLILIAPITTKYNPRQKKKRIYIHNRQSLWLKESWIILNQIKVISLKRFAGIISNSNNRSLYKYVLHKYIHTILQK